VEYETFDAEGGRCEVKACLVVTGGNKLPVPLVLLAERGEVSSGEQARFLISSALPGQKLLLEIWRAGLRVKTTWISSDSSPRVLAIPVHPADRGSLSLRVWTARSGKYLEAMATVRMNPAARQLIVSAPSTGESADAGATVRWPVMVKRADGRDVPPQSVELLAFLVERRRGDPLTPQYLSTAPLVEGISARALERSVDWAVSGNEVRSERARQMVAGPFEVRRFRGFGGSRNGMERMAEELSVPTASTHAGALPLPREPVFWFPHLIPDATGTAVVEATLPNADATWDFWVYASDVEGGRGWLHREVRAQQKRGPRS
jgi:uncharacterized protein YfaS (alpha-2-macroglobulin family)